MSAIIPAFSGEMQLAGWSESHTGGCKVSFWLQSPDDLAAFRTLTTRKGNTAGHRFMAALVEIGDDEQPVQPPPNNAPNIGEAPPNTEKTPLGPLAYWLVLRCNELEFWMWLLSIGYDVHNSGEAGDAVKDLLGLQSRKDLDTNPVAVEMFHSEIRGPYSKYLAARGIVK